mgnify:CR=1 FL=1
MEKNGLIFIDKQVGMTSRDVDFQIMKIFGTKKVGHLGTLDPFASGLLVVGVNEGTKLLSAFEESEKTYEAELILGKKTNTGDLTGEVVEEKDVPEIDDRLINVTLKTFLGKSTQTPPMYSAIKVNGKKLYEYARKGQTIEIKPREIEIYSIELLNINNDGMIGYLTIDKIKVELPIYHGISNEVLNSSVGHLEGSSLPIGGNSTHSVLSAHRGLPSAKLFTDLDKLEVGDIFKITVLDEVLTYEVDKIVIVSPSDREYLKIEEDKDYVTLLTCTPYGINTHRLLVRGVRVTGNTKKNYITTEGFRINRMIVIPIVALPIIVLLLLIILIKPVKRVGINKYEEFLYPNGKR